MIVPPCRPIPKPWLSGHGQHQHQHQPRQEDVSNQSLTTRSLAPTQMARSSTRTKAASRGHQATSGTTGWAVPGSRARKGQVAATGLCSARTKPGAPVALATTTYRCTRQTRSRTPTGELRQWTRCHEPRGQSAHTGSRTCGSTPTQPCGCCGGSGLARTPLQRTRLRRPR